MDVAITPPPIPPNMGAERMTGDGPMMIGGRRRVVRRNAEPLANTTSAGGDTIGRRPYNNDRFSQRSRQRKFT